MTVKKRFPSLPYHEFGGTEGNIITIDLVLMLTTLQELTVDILKDIEIVVKTSC